MCEDPWTPCLRIMTVCRLLVRLNPNIYGQNPQVNALLPRNGHGTAHLARIDTEGLTTIRVRILERRSLRGAKQDAYFRTSADVQGFGGGAAVGADFQIP